jgi:flavin reductase (DIM6/NTAB) family NADH-FMN oxidoreductase RutF
MTSFTPGPETQRHFRDALGRFATGITIVTTGDAGRPLGITANSFASVSIDPPLVLWSPARASRRFAAFEAAEHFAIHIVGAHQRALAHDFVRNARAFEGFAWEPDANGTPLIGGCLARFDCTRHAVHDGGDHAIIVGHVHSATVGEGEPLIFTGGEWGLFLATA